MSKRIRLQIKSHSPLHCPGLSFSGRCVPSWGHVCDMFESPVDSRGIKAGEVRPVAQDGGGGLREVPGRGSEGGG